MPASAKVLGTKQATWFHGARVPMRIIRQFARDVAKRFQPEKIILFGSHAYGTPHADSDVDMLVVMAGRNQLDMDCKIDREIEAQFPLDLIVRKPERLAQYLEAKDPFHTEIVERGIEL